MAETTPEAAVMAAMRDALRPTPAPDHVRAVREALTTIAHHRASSAADVAHSVLPALDAIEAEMGRLRADRTQTTEAWLAAHEEREALKARLADAEAALRRIREIASNREGAYIDIRHIADAALAPAPPGDAPAQMDDAAFDALQTAIDNPPEPNEALRALMARGDAPGHTDLMVTPEAIDAFVEANPPAPEREGVGLRAPVRQAADSIERMRADRSTIIPHGLTEAAHLVGPLRREWEAFWYRLVDIMETLDPTPPLEGSSGYVSPEREAYERAALQGDAGAGEERP